MWGSHRASLQPHFPAWLRALILSWEGSGLWELPPELCLGRADTRKDSPVPREVSPREGLGQQGRIHRDRFVPGALFGFASCHKSCSARSLTPLHKNFLQEV